MLNLTAELGSLNRNVREPVAGYFRRCGFERCLLLASLRKGNLPVAKLGGFNCSNFISVFLRAKFKVRAARNTH